MRRPQRKPNDLLAYWQRYDWRETMFAPGVAILQALTLDGATASGLGSSRDSAFARCLGETAESHALSSAGGADLVGYAPERDGLAAHPESARAREAALLEAYERLVVCDWWQGLRLARPLHPDWLTETGVAARISKARCDANQKRRTEFWQVESERGPLVVIARSVSLAGQEPILGYGCDLTARGAAGKALREMLLMEVNLMEVLATRATGAAPAHDVVQEHIDAVARRTALLFPTAAQARPRPDLGALSLDEVPDWFAIPPELRDITPPEGPIAVWHCRPALPVPAFGRTGGTPFM